MERLKALSLFGPDGDFFVTAVSGIAGSLGGQGYRFMDGEQFRYWSRKSGARWMNQTYWREMLFRAHIGASVGFLRNERWLRGAIRGAEDENFFCFSACLRALLESIADGFDSLGKVPSTLALHSATIFKAVAGTLDEVVLSQELEQTLLHFSHARKGKKGEAILDVHKAKTSRAYLEAWGKEAEDPLHRCYSELCEVTHPASDSVGAFISASATPNEFILDRGRDAATIQLFAQRYAPVMERVFPAGFTLPLITLRVLNVFKLPEIATPEVDRFSFDRIAGWREIEQMLSRSGWVKVAVAESKGEPRS